MLPQLALQLHLPCHLEFLYKENIRSYLLLGSKGVKVRKEMGL
jgi:hypothetical protein